MSKAKIEVGTEIKGKTSRAGADKVAKTRGGGSGERQDFSHKRRWFQAGGR